MHRPRVLQLVRSLAQALEVQTPACISHALLMGLDGSRCKTPSRFATCFGHDVQSRNVLPFCASRTSLCGMVANNALENCLMGVRARLLSESARIGLEFALGRGPAF